MKYVKTTAFLIFILLFCFTLTPVAHAEEPSEVYSDFFGSLPDKIKDTLPEKVNGSDPEADTKRLTSWDFLLSALGGGVSSGFRRILPTFCAILGLILISSVINTVTSSLEPKTSKVLGITSNAAMTAAFVSLQIKTILSVGEYLSDLCANSRFGDKVIDEVASFVAQFKTIFLVFRVLNFRRQNNI